MADRGAPACTTWRLLALLPLSCFLAPSFADSWHIRQAAREYHFGDGLRIVASNDAASTPEIPLYQVRIFRGRKLLARYLNLCFEKLVTAPDGKLFVGLSNHGFPGTAAVVFDPDGRILRELIHPPAFIPGISEHYCHFSMTLSRVWYDDNDPSVTFGPGGDPDSITLRDCRGRRINLVQEFADVERRARQVRQEMDEALDRMIDQQASEAKH